MPGFEQGFRSDPGKNGQSKISFAVIRFVWRFEKEGRCGEEGQA